MLKSSSTQMRVLASLPQPFLAFRFVDGGGLLNPLLKPPTHSRAQEGRLWQA